jgi:hypothetical protein
MTDVTVTNRRADSSANEDLTKLARHGADTFGYKANLRIRPCWARRARAWHRAQAPTSPAGGRVTHGQWPTCGCCRDGLTVPRSIRGLGDGVDVLGRDGYAVAPPSAITICPKHPDVACGTRYAWMPLVRRLAPLPAWIPQHLQDRQRRPWDRHADDLARENATAPSPRNRRVRHPRRYALAALRGETDRVATAVVGIRHDMLNYAAWRLAPHLHDGTLTESEIRTALTRAADACGLTGDDGARSVHTTITAALRSGGRSL